MTGVTSTMWAAVVAIGLVAAGSDLKWRRVPNFLTLGAAIVAVVYHSSGGLASTGWSLLGWVTGVAVFFPVFALRGMGAGDVKLLGALGAWLGPVPVLWIALYTSIAGGVIALLVACATGYLRTATQHVYGMLLFWRVMGMRPVPEMTLASAAPRLPYAVPIAIGLGLTLWLRP